MIENIKQEPSPTLEFAQKIEPFDRMVFVDKIKNILIDGEKYTQEELDRINAFLVRVEESVAELSNKRSSPREVKNIKQAIDLYKDFLSNLANCSDEEIVDTFGRIFGFGINTSDSSEPTQDNPTQALAKLNREDVEALNLRDLILKNALLINSFGLQTNPELAPQVGTGKGEFKVHGLSTSFINGTIAILEQLGYAIRNSDDNPKSNSKDNSQVQFNLDVYNGIQDLNTFRKFPYAVFHLNNHGVLLLESFIYGNQGYIINLQNSEFIKNLSKLKKIELTQEISLADLISVIYMLTKAELESVSGVTGYRHNTGWTSVVLNNIQGEVQGDINSFKKAGEAKSDQKEDKDLDARLIKIRDGLLEGSTPIRSSDGINITDEYSLFRRIIDKNNHKSKQIAKEIKALEEERLKKVKIILNNNLKEIRDELTRDGVIPQFVENGSRNKKYILLQVIVKGGSYSENKIAKEIKQLYKNIQNNKKINLTNNLTEIRDNLKQNKTPARTIKDKRNDQYTRFWNIINTNSLKNNPIANEIRELERQRQSKLNQR